MNIAFTICSNNYLAQAKVLVDSILKNSENFKLYIGLCDEKSQEIDYSIYPCEIIQIKDLGLANFDELWKKYDIIELNTSVKASFFKYLLNKNSNVDFIYYFDPDIEIFNDLEILNSEFDEESHVLLTPHILSHLPLDNKTPGENIFLNYGLFNLGFLGLRNKSIISMEILDWWEERTLSMGFNNVSNGLFVDQLWVNLLPIYHDKIKILKKMGYNAAPWNLHERINFNLSVDGNYIMPDNSMLVFYHFSNYKYSQPDILSTYYNRYSFDDSKLLKCFYNDYLQKVLKNNIVNLSKIECVYITKRKEFFKNTKSIKIKESVFLKIIRNVLPPIIFRKLS